MASSEVGADLWVSEYITPWDIYVHGLTRVLAYKKTAYQEMYIDDKLLLLLHQYQPWPLFPHFANAELPE